MNVRHCGSMIASCAAILVLAFAVAVGLGRVFSALGSQAGHVFGTAAQADAASPSAPPGYPDRPNLTLTPGAIRATDQATINATEAATEAARPGQAVKDQVYREYGLDPRHHEPCEVDHLISIELGGSNDIKNLWPEHYANPAGAHQKDALENELHKLIVAGTITVPEAQHAISADWIQAYKQYMRADPSQ